MPDYIKYQKSISNELISIKDRVRDIIEDSHWGEEGRYKEVILSDYLRKHLPDNVSVGTGFIINETIISSQIDIIVYNNSIPLLFQQGDFVIVPSESVLGVIEVKTKLNPQRLLDVIKKSSEINILFGDRKPFNGIFSYEWYSDKCYVSDMMKTTLIESNGAVNYLCLGQNFFVKFWEVYHPDNSNCNPHYSFYKINDLSFGYFISNLIEDIFIANTDSELPDTLKRMFYPIENTKEAHRIFDLEI